MQGAPSAPRRYKTGHSKTCRFCAGSSDEGAREYAFRSYDANLFRVHFHPLGERYLAGTAVLFEE
jgi:hypothetical protein